MPCLGCNRIDIATVTLRDGRVVCNECEDWRAECEARHVANMEDNDARLTFLRHVGERRGEEAARALRKAARAIYQEAKKNAQDFAGNSGECESV